MKPQNDTSTTDKRSKTMINLRKRLILFWLQFLQLVRCLEDCWHAFLKFLWFLIRVGQPVSNLVSYAQSTIMVISGRPRHGLCQVAFHSASNKESSIAE